LRDPGVLCAGTAIIAAVSATLVVLTRTPRGAIVADRFRFAIPVLGPLARKADVAACARTLGTTLGCGVPLASALEAAASMTRSIRLRRVFADVGEAVAFGQHVAPTFASSGLFDPIFVGLVRAGEESGALDTMLVRVAEYFEDEVRTTATTLAAIVEPLLIIFLGGAIAAIVAAVLVPLYSTIGSIS
jgi:type IV pilus assembly protein PilC